MTDNSKRYSGFPISTSINKNGIPPQHLQYLSKDNPAIDQAALKVEPNKYERKAYKYEQFQISQSPKIAESKYDFRNELQNLKGEVKKIVENKQSCLPQRTLQKNELTSCKSQTLLRKQVGLTNQKSVEALRLSDNFDYSKYLQLQNSQLKSQIMNAKTRHNNEMKEASEKIELLEKKCLFLEESLTKYEETMAAQIQSMKQTVKEVMSNQINSNAIDSNLQFNNKTSEQKDSNYEGLLQKQRQLYSQLTVKNKQLNSQLARIEELKKEMNQLRMEKNILQDKTKNINSERQAMHCDMELINTRLDQQNQKNNFLTADLQALRELREKEKLQNERLAEQMRGQFLKNLKQVELEGLKYRSSAEQFQNKYEFACEEVNYLKNELHESNQIIYSLNLKLNQENLQKSELEQKHQRILEEQRRAFDDALKTMQLEYQNKLISVTPKSKKAIEEPSSYKKLTFLEIDPENELSRYRVECQMLKQKYQNFLNFEQQLISESQESYRQFRECKQKLDIFSHKIPLLEKEFKRCQSTLSEKYKELLQKQIQLRKVENEATSERRKAKKELNCLQEEYKILEMKYNDQLQFFEREVNYRKMIEDKLNGTIKDEGLRETIEKMKKRIDEQDEKSTKIVKELKSKDNLIARLKGELSDTVQTIQKRLNEEKALEMKKIVDDYLSKQFQNFTLYKEKTEQEMQILEASLNNLLDQNQQLKQRLTVGEREFIAVSNQLKEVSYLYNNKCIDFNSLMVEKNSLIDSHSLELAENNLLKENLENNFKAELIKKEEEISQLRLEVLSSRLPYEMIPSKANFNEQLASHIETEAKLKEESKKKTEQIFKLRDNYNVLSAEYDNMKSENEINKLRMLSEKKNLEVSYQVEQQNLRNQLSVEEKKCKSLEQKLSTLIEENKKKDAFIQSFIVNKRISQSQKDMVTQFIRQYQISMGGADIKEKLSNDLAQIVKLEQQNEALIREISRLKEDRLYQDLSMLDKPVSSSSIKHIKSVESPLSNFDIPQ